MHLGLRSRLQQRRHHLPAEHHAGTHVREEDVSEPHGVVVAQQLEHLLHVRHRRQLLQAHACFGPEHETKSEGFVRMEDGCSESQPDSLLVAHDVTQDRLCG